MVDTSTPRNFAKDRAETGEREKGWIARARFALRAWRSATCRDSFRFEYQKQFATRRGPSPPRDREGLTEAVPCNFRHRGGAGADFRWTAVIRGAIVLSRTERRRILKRVWNAALYVIKYTHAACGPTPLPSRPIVVPRSAGVRITPAVRRVREESIAVCNWFREMTGDRKVSVNY